MAQASKPSPRIGHGYDLHRLEPVAPQGPGRPFVLAGVPFDHPLGPVGHSDGDVVYHAVTDAILGALGQADIGQLFADTDPRHEGADSILFVEAAVGRMRAAGYRVANLDITVICQRPKIADHKDRMTANLAGALGCDTNCVNLKGKTHEEVDAVGEGRAVEAHAVVLLETGGMEPSVHNDLWHEAAAMAARTHHNQRREDPKQTPYFSHPARVALTVAVKFGCTDEEVLAAAFLHDVLEDTLVDYDDLLKRFGENVAEMVAKLSKDPRLVEEVREKTYDENLVEADWKTMLVKLADVYDNLSDATNNKMRRKMLDKAERALVLARKHPELEKASALVRALVEETQRSMPA
jgi:2-C-methyl-D-erythritol 2,4-cyclodiphosphate synthase